MSATISGPVSMRVHKKVGTDDYILYHPQTGDNDVLIGTTRWEGTGFIPTALYKYTGDSVTTSTASVSWVSLYKGTYPYVKLSEYLTYINDQIENFGGVLEFVGTNSIDTIVGLTPTEKDKGKVYIVQNTTTSPIHRIVWRPGSSGDWVEYPSNTLFVYVNTPHANYINYVYTSGTTTSYGTAKAGWVPLGGSNDVYAKKTEALGSVTYTGSTFTFSYVSGGIATTFAIPTIGTVAAGTSAIVSTITSGTAGGAIPDVDAVRNYAGSAGKIDTVAEGNDGTSYYLVGAAVSGASTGQEAISSDIKITHHTNGPDLVEGAKFANLTIHTAGGDETYDGSAGRVLHMSNGLTAVVSSGNVTVSVKGSSGISVSASGVSVRTGMGITINGSSSIAIAGAHTISAGAGITVSGDTTYQGTAKTTTISLAVSGVSTGVYSALQIDPYGRAIAGAQSLVFAPSLQSTDLSALVVGGLAFIGADETGNNSSYSAPDGTVITSSNIS